VLFVFLTFLDSTQILLLSMCAALALNTNVIRPGKWIGFWRKRGKDQLVWAGFARSESLDWWKRRGGELVDVPAHRFAERSDRTRNLTWDDILPGHVVRGLVDPNEGKPLLKIVTRASSEEELNRFGHPRMPVIEPRLFSAELFQVTSPAPAQVELF
jgi:hypothetical protein